MRTVLALLIGLALVMSPVMGAMATCGTGRPVASVEKVAMPGMSAAALTRAVSDPACDHSAKSGKSRGQACAAACCLGAVLPNTPASPLAFFQRGPTAGLFEIALRSSDLLGLDPPPKSIA